MKTKKIIASILAVTAITALTGCRTPENELEDDQEYSNMPWNTPESWEGSQSIPGMSQGNY